MADDMFEKILSLKSQVGLVLKRNVEARNDDMLLVRLVCQQFKYDPVAKASGIERIRRHYNQKGDYLPTRREVAIKRNLNIENWEQALGYKRNLMDFIV